MLGAFISDFSSEQLLIAVKRDFFNPGGFEFLEQLLLQGKAACLERQHSQHPPSPVLSPPASRVNKAFLFGGKKSF